MASQPGVKMQERILVAAGRLFLANGFLRTSMDAVAEAAAITKRTLYRYYPSKDALVEALLEDLIEVGSAPFDERVGARAPLGERLRGALEFLAAQAERVSPAFFADVEAALPGQHRRMQAFRRERLAKLVRLLEEGQRTGAVPAEIRPEVAIEWLLAGIERFTSPAYRLGNPSAGDALRTVFELFLRGVLKRRR